MNADLTSKQIENILNNNRSYLAERRAEYDAYRGDDLPIQDRVLEGNATILKKLEADFRGLIVNSIVGYLFSVPITYRMKNVDDVENNKILQDFLLRNDFSAKDQLTGKLCSICGYAGRLFYLNTKGEESFDVILPWEAIWIYNRFGSVDVALRWYSYLNIDNTTEEYIEAYDTQKVVFYSKDGAGWNKTEEKLHYFGCVPLIRVEGSEDLQSDTKKVETLINCYCEVLSSANEEILQHRLALLVFSGAAVDETEMIKAGKSGMGGLNIPADSSVEWLIKALPDSFLSLILSTLEKDILRFSGSVDFSDPQFASGNNTSGIAIKFKLIQFENRAAQKETLFKSALKYQFDALASSLAKKGINFPAREVLINFNRNLPINLLDETELFNTYWGKLSPETVLSLLSFVSDPQAEAAKIENKENELNDLIQDNNINNQNNSIGEV